LFNIDYFYQTIFRGDSLDRNEYYKIIKDVTPKDKKYRNYLLAFFMGGLISFLAELINIILSEYTSISLEDRTIIIIFLFILIGAILTGVGIFDNLVQIFGAGLFIPITGFSNAICSEAMEYKSEGPIYGIGANMFKLAGSVITYGVVTSIILSFIYALFT